MDWLEPALILSDVIIISCSNLSAGGEIDVPELAGILKLRSDAGYVGKDRGVLVIEMQLCPGMSEDDSAKDNFARLAKAWATA